MEVHAWLIDWFNPPSEKLPYGDDFPGGSKKWPNTAGQYSAHVYTVRGSSSIFHGKNVFSLKISLPNAVVQYNLAVAELTIWTWPDLILNKIEV